MGRIDELIEEMRYEFLPKEMPIIKKHINKLRIYVELAELMASDEWNGTGVDKFEELNEKARNLIKQIREAQSGQN